MIRILLAIWIMFFNVFFCNIIRINDFLYRFIILLHLVSSFSFTRLFMVPYAYVFIELIDCIHLILLISSVKTLSRSLLNHCCVFNINLLFLMNCLFSLVTKETIYANFTFSRWFILFSN